MKATVLLLICLMQGISAQSCDTDGDIRLVGGRDDGEGRLELCRNGQWGTVCNEGWDLVDAQVACRQLFSEVNLEAVATDLYFPGGDSSQVVHLTEVNCAGDEATLLDCTSTEVTSQSQCDSTRAVGIICNVTQPECTSGDVRLEGGPFPDEGRVEYCVGSRWGTVCNSMFDEDDVAVVCTQQGFLADPSAELNSPGSFFLIPPGPTPSIGATVRPIVLSGLQCTGTESQLSDCARAASISSCSHNMDAGARCGCPNNYELRLADGVTANDGRVEYCLDGEWRVLCRNGVDFDAITVMCRQLGIEPTHVGFVPANEISNNAVLQRGGPSALQYSFMFQCTGNELRLADCMDVALVDSCSTPGIGISCPDADMVECDFGDIRLQDGLLSGQIGRVEVCANGRWGLVCDDDWGVEDATVACRQLGYEGAGVPLEPCRSRFGVMLPNQQCTTRFGNEMDAPFLLDDLGCVGNEESLFECSHSGITFHNCLLPFNDASLICGTTNDRCPEGGLDISANDTVVPSDDQPLTVPGFGTCQPFESEDTLCRNYIDQDAYVFILEDSPPQSQIRSMLDTANIVIDVADELCQEQVSRALCTYFYPPCGNSTGVHLPLSLCPEECQYVSESCDSAWDGVMRILSREGALGAFDCVNTSRRFAGLSACCIGAGIIIPPSTTAMPPPPTTPPVPSTPPLIPSPDDSSLEELVAPLAGGIIAAIVLIVIVLVVIVICLFLTNVKRKKIVKEIQMEVLTNPQRAVELSPPPRDQPSPLAKAMSISPTPSPTSFKMRNGSSKKVVPNAYSSMFAAEKELDFSAPLLNPLSGKSTNRISSSMIRELSSDMVIPYCRLNLLDCIGQGEFGVVYKAEYNQPMEDDGYDIVTVAVKTLKGFFDKDKVDSIMEESLKMKHFDHPNVLGLTGVCLDAGPAPYVVMPYMANGSLLHYLKKERRDIVLAPEVDDDVKVDIRKRLTIMALQIANGMDYLADEKFVHRDLAARNCMIDLHFVIKISDFGLSEDVYSKNYFRQGDDNSVKLPVKWMAPESLNDGVFSEKTDVWSFGVTCWEVFSGGKTPYPGVDPMQLSELLDQGKRLNKPVNSACSDEIYDLMRKCWAMDPDKRPPFADIAQTFSGYIETLAGYLDMSFNPFTPVFQEQRSLDTGNNTGGISNDVLAHPEQLAALYHNIPRKSPSRSPRASPRASPLHSPTSKNKGLPSASNPSTNIKIQIDSCSPPPPQFNNDAFI